MPATPATGTTGATVGLSTTTPGRTPGTSMRRAPRRTGPPVAGTTTTTPAASTPTGPTPTGSRSTGTGTGTTRTVGPAWRRPPPERVRSPQPHSGATATTPTVTSIGTATGMPGSAPSTTRRRWTAPAPAAAHPTRGWPAAGVTRVSPTRAGPTRGNGWSPPSAPRSTAHAGTR